MDAHNPVADDSTSYGARLKRLTEGITEVDGLPLNFNSWWMSTLSPAETVRSGFSQP